MSSRLVKRRKKNVNTVVQTTSLLSSGFGVYLFFFSLLYRSLLIERVCRWYVCRCCLCLCRCCFECTSNFATSYFVHNIQNRICSKIEMLPVKAIVVAHLRGVSQYYMQLMWNQQVSNIRMIEHFDHGKRLRQNRARRYHQQQQRQQHRQKKMVKIIEFQFGTSHLSGANSIKTWQFKIAERICRGVIRNYWTEKNFFFRRKYDTPHPPQSNG